MEASHSADPKSIARAAILAAAAGVLGLAAVAAWLRGGLPFGGADIARRAAYLSHHRQCWTWGWLIAAIGAILVVNLYRAMAAQWQDRAGPACRLATALAVTGLGVDLSGIALWIVVAPHLAPEDLGLVERIAGALSLFAAKLLYAAAGSLLTLAGRREMGKPLTALAAAVWLGGLCVAAATWLGSGPAQFWSLGALATLFIVWSTLLGLRFFGIGWVPSRAGDSGFTPDPRD